MDMALQTIARATQTVESLIPSPIPVPSPVDMAASKLSEVATSMFFPYRIKNIDVGDVLLWQALIVIFLHPCIWNVIGRFEHYTRLLSFLFLNGKIGTYALALWIFLAGLYRDALFVAAMENQNKLESLAAPEYRIAAIVLTACGVVLVLTSFYQLGMTGTFLGDYFGILMKKRITAFPFNVMSDPMYNGSTMIFLGKAILYVEYLQWLK